MSRLKKSTWVLAGVAIAIPLLDVLLSNVGLGRWAIGNEVAQRVLVFTHPGVWWF